MPDLDIKNVSGQTVGTLSLPAAASNVQAVIGGNTVTARNVFSCFRLPFNGSCGTSISTSTAGPTGAFVPHLVQGNYFGLAVDGMTPISTSNPNGDTTWLEMTATQVGGLAAGEGNVFAGRLAGMRLTGRNGALGNRFQLLTDPTPPLAGAMPLT